MSWSFEVVGTKEEVKKVIDGQSHCPEKLREEMKSRVDLLHLDAYSHEAAHGMKFAARVKSHGHLENTYGGNATIEIARVQTAGLDEKKTDDNGIATSPG